MKLSKAQRFAISLLLADYGHIYDSPERLYVSDGNDDFKLNWKTFRWLSERGIITDGHLMSLDSDMYRHHITNKGRELAKEAKIKPYSED